MGVKITSTQQEENEIDIKYGKIILLTPLLLCLRFFYDFLIFLYGIANNVVIIIKGRNSERFTKKILKFNQLDYLLGRMILFRTDKSFSERKIIIEEELEQINNSNTINKRIIVLERIGGAILYFHTKIIYRIFLLVNWITFLLIKLVKKTSKAVDEFINNCLIETHQTNLYLAGIKDDRVRFKSLDDPIAGVFYPLLTHGFSFGYFLLYAYLVILRCEYNPITLIDSAGYYDPGEIAHIVISAFVIYYSLFLFLIPYYLQYPDKINDKRLVEIWKEIGFTIRYPLRDIFILIFYVAVFLLLYNNIIEEIINSGTVSFNTLTLERYIVMGFFWSIAEEISFRGYLIMGLERKKIHSIIAVIICSSLFGFYHSFQTFPDIYFGYNVLYALLIGILLSIIRVKSKSIIVPFIIHLFDYIFFSGTFLITPRTIPFSGVQHKYVVLMVIITITSILVFLIYPRDSKKKNEIKNLNNSSSNLIRLVSLFINQKS
ncbi:MAG TPA: CPBP family intramembrane glutamic endopeptidase [candidate division Zixibacteria bacterium]|nr:CPBP family intramembrane glutamic endopeptidase [candidate division Zixibacteria bacterium]